MDSDFMSNLANAMKNGNIPDDIKNLMNNMKNNSQENHHNNQNNSQCNDYNSNDNSDSNQNTNSLNPDMLKNIISMFNSSNNSNSTNGFENDNNSNNENSNNSIPNFDINMFLKMKSIMDKMNNNKNDPRANLLMSLKPYLKESRKSRVEQYVQFLNMSKVIEAFNQNGGENIK